jgi:hypothetical protein
MALFSILVLAFVLGICSYPETEHNKNNKILQEKNAAMRMPTERDHHPATLLVIFLFIFLWSLESGFLGPYKSLKSLVLSKIKTG